MVTGQAVDADPNAFAVDTLFGAAAGSHDRPVDAFATDQPLARQACAAGIDDDRRKLRFAGIGSRIDRQTIGIRIKICA
ncbi:hypothetical protein [Mesorhizobium sp.]|uniref:hypothetical protein n=1 Tax=Mesorhizobium sp. TaxID=1871066 RepID=UPI00257B2FE2|nr:hypothetical protein [Mesorhizobium sp.]